MKGEAKLKDEVKQFLNSIGAYWFMPVQMGYGVSGTPDFLCCIKGRFVGIETKAKGKKPSKFQEYRIKQINEAGGCAFWATSLEDVKDHMRQFGWQV